jgi:hypothetical protein
MFEQMGKKLDSVLSNVNVASIKSSVNKQMIKEKTAVGLCATAVFASKGGKYINGLLSKVAVKLDPTLLDPCSKQ